MEEPFYEELFDIINDPKEQNNLVSTPLYKEELAYFRNRCTTLVKKLN